MTTTKNCVHVVSRLQAAERYHPLGSRCVTNLYFLLAFAWARVCVPQCSPPAPPCARWRSGRGLVGHGSPTLSGEAFVRWCQDAYTLMLTLIYHSHIRTHIYRSHIHIHIYIHTYIHTHSYIYIHTYIHTHTHILTIHDIHTKKEKKGKQKRTFLFLFLMTRKVRERDRERKRKKKKSVT